MALSLSNAVVEFENFHRLMALLTALQAMLIESYLTIRYILLSLEENVQEFGL